MIIYTFLGDFGELISASNEIDGQVHTVVEDLVNDIMNEIRRSPIDEAMRRNG